MFFYSLEQPHIPYCKQTVERNRRKKKSEQVTKVLTDVSRLLERSKGAVLHHSHCPLGPMLEWNHEELFL